MLREEPTKQCEIFASYGKIKRWLDEWATYLLILYTVEHRWLLCLLTTTTSSYAFLSYFHSIQQFFLRYPALSEPPITHVAVGGRQFASQQHVNHLLRLPPLSSSSSCIIIIIPRSSSASIYTYFHIQACHHQLLPTSPPQSVCCNTF